MYGISGERHIAGREIDWLPGYEASSPERVGNAAQKQTQQDIYGEIAAVLLRGREAGNIGIASSTYDIVGLPPIKVQIEPAGGK